LTWIVTGGAGYIGAHVVHLLRARGHDVVVFDDLSTGRPDRLPAEVQLVKGSVSSPDDLDNLFGKHPADGVVHLAAYKVASESILDPALYWQKNVDGVRYLLAAMRTAGVKRLMFASSAAVYGDTGDRPVPERRSAHPVNPYGITKCEGERIIAEATGPELRALVFRQFNVVGAGLHPYAVDTAPASLLPAIFQAISGGPDLVVRGRGYPTPDGSAVRDFIDVRDVANAYVRGVEHLYRPRRRHRIVNLGSGEGTSVLDLVRTTGRVAGIKVPCHDGPPRIGDAAAVVAAVGRARRMGLGTRHRLEDAVSSAWESWRTYVAPEAFRRRS
jgi:UDP-glucose 4-epimerase